MCAWRKKTSLIFLIFVPGQFQWTNSVFSDTPPAHLTIWWQIKACLSCGVNGVMQIWWIWWSRWHSIFLLFKFTYFDKVLLDRLVTHKKDQHSNRPMAITLFSPANICLLSFDWGWPADKTSATKSTGPISWKSTTLRPLINEQWPTLGPLSAQCMSCPRFTQNAPGC